MTDQERSGDHHLDKLLADAHWAVTALDLAMSQGRSGIDGSLIERARETSARLLEYRKANELAAAESVPLQDAIDMLRARLRFLGVSV